MKKKNIFAFTCPHEHFLTETEMNTNKFHRSKTKRNNLNNFTPNFFRSYDFSFRSETCMPRTSTVGDDLAVRRTWQTEWLAWRTPDVLILVNGHTFPRSLICVNLFSIIYFLAVGLF